MAGELASALGRAAREARARIGLTQAIVAERIDVATEVYGRLERGLMLPSVETLCRLCRVLRVSSDVLLGLVQGSSGPEPGLPDRPPATCEESPDVRRLVRRVKRLDPRRLRLLGLLAAELGQSEHAGDGAD